MSCQDHLYRGMHPRDVSRRWFFKECGVGVGAAALMHLLAEAGYAADDPLAPKLNQDSKRRLHDTINSLNRNQKHALIRFLGDGKGEGVRWGFVEQRPNDHLGREGTA